MTLTVAQLLALADSGALHAVAEAAIPAATGWRLQRLPAALGPELQRATAARFALLTDDNSVSVGHLQRRLNAGREGEYLAALQPLLAETVEIAAAPLDRAGIEGARFTAAQLAALEPILDSAL